MTEMQDTLSWGEEKKEASPERPSCFGGEGSTRPTVRDCEIAARAGIPEEIKNTQYTSERVLRMDLEKLGLDDLHIILDEDGFPIWREMAGKAHVGAVRKIHNLFNEWKDGRPIMGSREENIFVNDSFNRPKNVKRCPDFAIFGPDRVTGLDVRSVDDEYMNPHVIIQFSWANDMAKEVLAVDDMMNYAGVGESYIDLGRPNVAYLIKALRHGTTSRDSPVYGFDIFQVEQGHSTPAEPTLTYRVGGEQEDTVISITPESMGLAPDTEGGPFVIEMSDIRETLELLKFTFVPA